MKNTVLILIFICAFVNTNAQINLVRNGGFEEYYHCPTTPDQIRYAKYWNDIDTTSRYPYGPVCSPEYCNSCDSLDVSGEGVPQGALYYHYCHSGNGMAQMEVYFDNSFSFYYQRDYVQGRLNSNLTAGKEYCVTFYVALEQGSQYAINHIGAYLDNGSIDEGQDSVGCASPQGSFIPQIVEEGIITDTFGWTKIQGSFTAMGGEKFITIGNFSNTLATDTIQRNLNFPPWNTSNQFSWYLLDDVSVIASDAAANAGPDRVILYGSTDSVQIGDTTGYLPCYWFKDGVLVDSNKAGFKVFPDTTSNYVMQLDVCGHMTTDTVVVHVGRVGIQDLGIQLRLVEIFPNPASNSVTIKGAIGCSLEIIDKVGKSVVKSEVQNNSQTFYIADLPAGVYFLQIQTTETGQKETRKFIKQ